MYRKERVRGVMRLACPFVMLRPCSRTVRRSGRNLEWMVHMRLLMRMHSNTQDRPSSHSKQRVLLPGLRQEAIIGVSVLWIVVKSTEVRTVKISLTKKYPPPPFLPFIATMAPGNNPMPLAPLILFRITRWTSNLRATREPPESMREDSMKTDDSINFESVSISWKILPTMTMSS